MKLFNLTLALAFSLTLAVGMGSKSKPATPIEAQKVLAESTRASDHELDPIELIENAAEDNQKVEQDLDKSTAHSGNLPNGKKAKKTKQVTKKKKAKSAKKTVKKAPKEVEIK
jgi:ribosomal protein S13